MLDSKAIGNKINDLRSKNKMSQDQMAEKLFVTRQAVSRWELGQSLPSIDSLLEMSHLFSVSFEDILCLNEKKTIDPNDLFNGHSREYVVKAIVRGDLKNELGDVFYQFSPEERMQILQAIRDKELKVDIQDLLPKLTSGEKVYLIGGKEHYVCKK